QAKLPREDNEVIALLWLIRIGEEAHTLAKTSRTTPEQILRETLLVFKYHGMNQSSTDELLQDGQHNNNILVTSDVYNAIPNFGRILWGIEEEEDAKMTYLDDDFIQLVRSNTVLSDLLVRYVFTRTLIGDEQQA